METVISFCEYTGNMVRPWAEAGYPCICVDIHQERTDEAFLGGGSITYVQADLFDYIPPLRKYRIAFAFPECTNLAVSGARWFQEKGLRGLAKGISLVERCQQLCAWTEAPYMIENPVGVLSSYWRKPDAIVQPWMYGDLESKATCIWAGNNFVVPEGLTVKPQGVKETVWKMPPSEDRGRLRSVMSQGFANAVFKANHGQKRSDAGVLIDKYPVVGTLCVKTDTQSEAGLCDSEGRYNY